MTVERIMEELDRAIADNEAKVGAANSETRAPARTNAQIA